MSVTTKTSRPSRLTQRRVRSQVKNELRPKVVTEETMSIDEIKQAFAFLASKLRETAPACECSI